MASQLKVIEAFNTDHLHADLKGRSLRGGVLSVFGQGVQVFLQSISTVVLARLLTPTDFGLVAMVTAVTAIAAGFADLGLTEATIQRKEINHNQVSTLFWINVGIGLLLTLVTAAMAPLLARFYHEPRLVGITLAVSFTFLLGGLRGQHNALLKRQMRFSSIAIRDITSSTLGVFVGIVMAWHGAGYWAIVAIPLTLNLTQMVISWAMVNWKPGRPRRDAEVRSMIGFGGKIATSYVIFNWIRNADNVLIGWYWGAGPLGLYSRAFNLLTLAVSQITSPASSVAIPAFSRIQSDSELFARYYLRIINLIVWVSATLFGFLFVSAKAVIVLVLGEKWQAATPVFQILTISALGQLLLESSLWLFVSRGQSSRLLKLMMMISPVILGSFVIGLPFGIKGVAVSLSLVLIVSLPWILKYTFRGTDLNLRSLGRALLYPVSLSLVGIIVAKLFLHLLAPHLALTQLLVSVLGFTITYSSSALVPQVRVEFKSFWKLLSELRLLRGSA